MVSWGNIYGKAGFYAGLSAGAGYNSGNFRGNATQIEDEQTFNIPNKISTSGFEKELCGFVGYMMHLSNNDWLAGLEFGIEKPFYKKHFEAALEDDLGPFPGNCQYRVKTMYVAKLHAKIGKILNEKWFAYGLVGVDMKKAEIFMQQELLKRMGKRKFLLGLAVGLGIEREISENWRLGLECVNAYYPPRTLKSINEDNDIRYCSRLKTNSTQISLRLIYNF